ncbi:helix-turn-helix domain-containing protein [Herbiconiux sp. YIM B11900]|uniref:helix-turn-helix domain-containing protein n=1 Tax=Herbiconiux sp. YIM B11900 TaxID=3404131 RepID=UPI003F8270BD
MNASSLSVDADGFSVELGSTIRRRRKELALSLVEVSGRTGLSHSFLSQLERGKTRASMRSLFSIAQALESTQEELIAAASGHGDDAAGGSSAGHGEGRPSRSDAPVPVGTPAGVRSGEGFETSGKARVQLLMHAGDQLDITEFSNLPRELGEFFEHDRPEFVYVVSGEIEFEMRSKGSATATSLLLKAGQTVSCPGGMLHRYRSVGDTLATVLMIHYP